MSPNFEQLFQEQIRVLTSSTNSNSRFWAIGTITGGNYAPLIKPHHVETLANLYRQEQDPKMRKAIIDAIASTGRSYAVSALATFKNEPDPDVRQYLVDSVLTASTQAMDYDDSEYMRTLKQCLLALNPIRRDSDPTIRQSAIEAYNQVEYDIEKF